MSLEEPPPSTSLPSTSTFHVSNDVIATSPLMLSLDFDKLSLNSELREGRYRHHTSPGPQSPTRITNMPPTEKNAQFYRICAHKNGRFSPYEVPFKLRRRRKNNKSADSKPIDMEVLLKIKLKGDVEPLKMCIFDKDKVIASKPCSVQAARPPSASSTDSEEIDELSEYFTHFVRVELKMSALAESMYV